MISWTFRQHDAKPVVLGFPKEGRKIIHSELSPLERGHENKDNIDKVQRAQAWQANDRNKKSSMEQERRGTRGAERECGRKRMVSRAGRGWQVDKKSGILGIIAGAMERYGLGKPT